MNTNTWHMSYYNYCTYCAIHAASTNIVKPKYVVIVINYHKFC